MHEIADYPTKLIAPKLKSFEMPTRNTLDGEE